MFSTDCTGAVTELFLKKWYLIKMVYIMIIRLLIVSLFVLILRNSYLKKKKIYVKLYFKLKMNVFHT